MIEPKDPKYMSNKIIIYMTELKLIALFQESSKQEYEFK